MRAKYIGSHKDSPNEVTWQGVTWTKGKAVEVPKTIEDKIRNHPSWEVSKTRKAKKAED